MDRNRLTETLKRHEGLAKVVGKRVYPYKCPAGYLTIGYGRNLDGIGISFEEAEILLNNDIDNAIKAVKIVFPDFDSIDDVRQEVLVNLMFNIGYLKFIQFKKMIAAVKIKDFKEAAKQLKDSQWYNQVGNRGKELVNMLEKGIINGKK